MTTLFVIFVTKNLSDVGKFVQDENGNLNSP
jgi:hypothetical protein